MRSHRGSYKSRRDNQGYSNGSRSAHNSQYSLSHSKREYQYVRPYKAQNEYYGGGYNDDNNHNNSNNNNSNSNTHNHNNNNNNSNNYNNNRSNYKSHSNSHSNYRNYMNNHDNDKNKSYNDINEQGRIIKIGGYLEDEWQGAWEVRSHGASNGDLMIVEFAQTLQGTTEYTLINTRLKQEYQLIADSEDSLIAHYTKPGSKYKPTPQNFYGILAQPRFNKVEWYEDEGGNRRSRRELWIRAKNNNHINNNNNNNDKNNYNGGKTLVRARSDESHASGHRSHHGHYHGGYGDDRHHHHNEQHHSYHSNHHSNHHNNHHNNHYKKQHYDDHNNNNNNNEHHGLSRSFSQGDEHHVDHPYSGRNYDYQNNEFEYDDEFGDEYDDNTRYGRRRVARTANHYNDSNSGFDLRIINNEDNATFLNTYNETNEMSMSATYKNKKSNNNNNNNKSWKNSTHDSHYDDKNGYRNNSKSKHKGKRYNRKGNKYENEEYDDNYDDYNDNDKHSNEENNNNESKNDKKNGDGGSNEDDNDSVDYNLKYHPNYVQPNWDLVSKLDLMPRENEAYNEWKSKISPNRVLIKREERIQNAINASKPKQIRREHPRSKTNDSYRASKYRLTACDKKDYEKLDESKKENSQFNENDFEARERERERERDRYQDIEIHGMDKPPHIRDFKYMEHIFSSQVDELLELKKNIVYVGELFISRWNPMIAYVHIDEIKRDVRVNGLIDRNRAFHGDVVAVSVYPKVEWTGVVKKEMDEFEERLNERDALAVEAEVPNEFDIEEEEHNNDDDDDDDNDDNDGNDDENDAQGPSGPSGSSGSSLEDMEISNVTDDDDDDNDNDNDDGKDDAKSDGNKGNKENKEKRKEKNGDEMLNDPDFIADIDDLPPCDDEIIYFDAQGHELASKSERKLTKASKSKLKLKEKKRSEKLKSQSQSQLNEEKEKEKSKPSPAQRERKKRRLKDWSFELIDPNSICAWEQYSMLQSFSDAWNDMDKEFEETRKKLRQQGRERELKSKERDIERWKTEIYDQLGGFPSDLLKNFKWDDPNSDLSLVARGKIVGIYDRKSESDDVPGYILPKTVPDTHGKIYKRWAMFTPLDARVPKAWFALKEAPKSHKQLFDAYEKEEMKLDREYNKALKNYAFNSMTVSHYELRRLSRRKPYSNYSGKLRKSDLTTKDLMILAKRDKSKYAPKKGENKYLARLKSEFLSVKYDLRWFEYETYPTCKFVRYLGKRGNIDVETDIILAKHNIHATLEFDEKLEENVSKLDIVGKEDYQGRLDCRDFDVFTIDPTTARDFDDALSIYKLDYKDKDGKDMYRVGIHIADVTHFVKPGSLVDNEAQKRATSVYLVDRCIPMLPHHLCQNLCSLNPSVDRLAYSVFVNINECGHFVPFASSVTSSDELNEANNDIKDNGDSSNNNGNVNDDDDDDDDSDEELLGGKKLKQPQFCSVNEENGMLMATKEWEKQSPWFGRSVIRSKARLNYEAAHWMIEDVIRKDSPLDDLPDCCSVNTKEITLEKVINDVKLFWHLAKQMRKRRFDNGSVEFHRTNIRFRLNEEGKSIVFCPEITLNSNKLIEEMMLFANQLVAAQLVDKIRKCALLRRHPSPDMERGKRIELICRTQKWNLDLGSSKALNDSLKILAKQQVNGMNVVEILNSLLTTPMERAEYICVGDSDEDFWSHWALNFTLYTHFTSPIRRYADVLVHRLLSYTLDSEKYLSEKPSSKKVASLCKVCNEKNLSAGRAEIDSKLIHLCLILHKKPLVVDGIIVELMKNCFTVVIPGLGIDRRVKLNDINKCQATILMELENSRLILNWEELEENDKEMNDDNNNDNDNGYDYDDYNNYHKKHDNNHKNNLNSNNNDNDTTTYVNESNRNSGKKKYKKKSNGNGDNDNSNHNNSSNNNNNSENDEFGKGSEVYTFFSKIRVMLSSKLTTPIEMETTVLSPCEREAHAVTVIPSGEILAEKSGKLNAEHPSDAVKMAKEKIDARAQAVAVTLEEQLAVGQEDFNGARYD